MASNNAIPTVDDGDEEDVQNKYFIDSFSVHDRNMEEENLQNIENRPSCSKQRRFYHRSLKFVNRDSNPANDIK